MMTCTSFHFKEKFTPCYDKLLWLEHTKKQDLYRYTNRWGYNQGMYKQEGLHFNWNRIKFVHKLIGL